MFSMIEQRNDVAYRAQNPYDWMSVPDLSRCQPLTTSHSRISMTSMNCSRINNVELTPVESGKCKNCPECAQVCPVRSSQRCVGGGLDWKQNWRRGFRTAVDNVYSLQVIWNKRIVPNWDCLPEQTLPALAKHISLGCQMERSHGAGTSGVFFSP